MVRFALGNGMRTVIDPAGRSDAVAVYVWVNVGSADEPAGLEGAAHFVEHMVFKGTRSFGVGEVAAAIEGLGGDLNAWTSFDETVFHATVPAAGAIATMNVLAEMLRTARFDPRELGRERKVILEEIRGGQDDPDSVLCEATYASAWPDHPYGRPVIGTTRSVRGMSVEALRSFYEHHYQPANACLAVAGSVDVEEVSRAARALFGGGGTAPPREARPPVGGARAPRALRRGFEACLVELAFPGPGLGDPAVARLDVLCAALGGGAASPLEARLRLKEGLCLSAEAGYSPERDGGMAVVSLHAHEGAATSAVAAAREEIEAARAGSLTEEIVARARGQILAGRVFGRETVDGRAHALAFHTERMGGPDAWIAYDEAVAAVTPADVTEAAQRWLAAGREVATALVPAGERLRLQRKNAAAPARETPSPEASAPPVFPADRVSATVAAPVSSRRLRSVQDRTRFVLPNGLRVVLDPEDGEVAAIRVAGLGGALGERRARAGRTTAWARLVVRGAGERDALAFAAAVESLAGTLGAAGGRSTQALRGEFVADRFEAGLELLADLLLRPSFLEPELERVRAEIAEALAEREDHPEYLLSERLWATATGGHPFGLPALGTEASLKAHSVAGIRAGHRRWAQARNLVVAVSGAFDPDRVRRQIEALLAGLPAGSPLALPEPPTHPPATRRISLRSGREQAHIAWAFPGVSVDDPTQPAVEILAAVLGGQGGRLFVELREAHGLAYSVGASSNEGVHPGLFICTVATDPGRAAEAEARLGESLARAAAGEITDEEVERARRYLLGGIALDLQTAGARASLAAYTELYGQDGLRYREGVARRLEQVSIDGVRTAAARILGRPLVTGRLVPERAARSAATPRARP